MEMYFQILEVPPVPDIISLYSVTVYEKSVALFSRGSCFGWSVRLP
jgi:hypothetical protein